MSRRAPRGDRAVKLGALAPVLAGALIVTGLAAAGGYLLSGKPVPDVPDHAASATTALRETPRPTSPAPAEDVARMHRALHRIGRMCQTATTARPSSAVKRDVDIVLLFARRYPEGRFPIDDETGSALSLLLVVRDELRDCAPAAAARVDRALPQDFRDLRAAP